MIPHLRSAGALLHIDIQTLCVEELEIVHMAAPCGAVGRHQLQIDASKKLSHCFCLLFFFLPYDFFNSRFLSGYIHRLRCRTTFPKKTNGLILFGKAKGRRRMASTPPFALIL